MTPWLTLHLYNLSTSKFRGSYRKDLKIVRSRMFIDPGSQTYRRNSLPTNFTCHSRMPSGYSMPLTTGVSLLTLENWYWISGLQTLWSDRSKKSDIRITWFGKRNRSLAKRNRLPVGPVDEIETALHTDGRASLARQDELK